MVRARRFYCRAVLCGRLVFAERFDDDVLAPWARRTARLDHIVHHLGLALGGRPAASFARRLMVPVSKDTLLRVIRRRGSPPFVPPTVIGIDDWAELPKVPPAQQVEWQWRGGAATSAMGRSSVIWSGGGRSRFCLMRARDSEGLAVAAAADRSGCA